MRDRSRRARAPKTESPEFSAFPPRLDFAARRRVGGLSQIAARTLHSAPGGVSCRTAKKKGPAARSAANTPSDRPSPPQRTTISASAPGSSSRLFEIRDLPMNQDDHRFNKNAAESWFSALFFLSSPADQALLHSDPAVALHRHANPSEKTSGTPFPGERAPRASASQVGNVRVTDTGSANRNKRRAIRVPEHRVRAKNAVYGWVSVVRSGGNLTSCGGGGRRIHVEKYIPTGFD
jgi:hypothetical protein